MESTPVAEGLAANKGHLENALGTNCTLLVITTPLRLILLLDEMRDQHGHTARQLPLLALAYIFDLFSDMVDVQLRQPTGTQQVCLLFGPGDDVRIVEPAGDWRLWRKNWPSLISRSLEMPDAPSSAQLRRLYRADRASVEILAQYVHT